MPAPWQELQEEEDSDAWMQESAEQLEAEIARRSGGGAENSVDASGFNHLSDRMKAPLSPLSDSNNLTYSMKLEG